MAETAALSDEEREGERVEEETIVWEEGGLAKAAAMGRWEEREKGGILIRAVAVNRMEEVGEFGVKLN